jgi:glycosyltransferase involved in cell wall biosynthesis
MLRAFGNAEKALLGIQGLCCEIAKEYMAELPMEVQQSTTFRDRLKNDSIVQQQEKYKIRAEHEREAILLTGHIPGRTEFDRDVTSKINPGARYFPMNETMRPCFYQGKWDSATVEPHSVFLSQGDYPLKGFHFMIQAMPKLLEKYPDMQLYVAGNNIIGKGDSKYPYFMRASAYGKYLKSLLFKNKLKKKVTMLGTLSDEEMKERFLKSSVFVCPSIVENSPNSMCEAMLLGMPVVAAKVGGIPSLIADKKEGVLFERADVEGLADAILQIWDEPVIAGVFGDNARKRAMTAHDPDANYRRLIEIYTQIAGE